MTGTIICILISVVYLAINLGLPRLPGSPLLRSYLFQPLLWVGLALIVRRLPAYRVAARYSAQATILQIGLGVAFVQVLVYAIGGLFSGFGKNPSSLSPLGILENLFFVGAMLSAMELSRASLLARFGKKRSFTALTFATLLFTFVSIPLSQITGFKFQIESTNQVISSWVPLLAENLLASLLALLAGARASLAYRGLLAAFWWLCPILPDLTWSLQGLIGAGVPILGMVAVSSYHASKARHGDGRQRAGQAGFPAGWILTALAAVVIVWFAVGVFPFQPSLVGSGSMSPVLQTGDIVIVAKVPADTVKVGDIIEYRRDKDTNIVHRVIEIDQSGGAKTFTTKGDANQSADAAPVIPDNVIGKVVFKIPKLGMVSIFVKRLFSASA
jgi:signal peptidase